MKLVPIMALLLALASGCGMEPTKAKVVIEEHKTNGTYYSLYFRVIEPKELAGRYGSAATLRQDLLTNVDGAEYEVYFNFSYVGVLTESKPLFQSPPSRPTSKSDDFLDSAKRLK